MAGLCETTRTGATSCCEPAPAAELDLLTNAPGQSKLRYRLGTFSTFRRRLLAELPARLERWRDVGRRDYGVALLEMWSTLADILTFYQERIANEAFLRTAVLRESLVRIAALVDYRPNPGAAASVYLAFRADTGKTVELARGFRTQTKPARGAAPVPFEIDEPLTVVASLNEMRVQSLTEQSIGFGDRHAVVEGIRTGLRPGDRVLVIGRERSDDKGNEQWEVRRVSSVIPDPIARTTRVEWKEPLGHRMPRVEPSRSPELYALRLQAWPFGYNAPDYDALTVTTTATSTTGGTTTTTTFTSTPTLADWSDQRLPHVQPRRTALVEDGRDRLLLDTIYPTLHADSWVVLVTSEPVTVPDSAGRSATAYPRGYAEVYRVRQVDETVASGFTLTAKVTRLTLDTVKQMRRDEDGTGNPTGLPREIRQPENIDIFPMQGTSLLGQSEHLPFAPVPLTADVSGRTLTLDARYPALRPGRLLILSGRQQNGTTGFAEVIRVKTVDHGGARTTVVLDADLARAYDPATVVIQGNVAPATHGETVANEILGSGDASQLFQSLILKKRPLTLVRAGGADANRWGTRAALEVRVNDVRWHEVPHMLDSAPGDRHYVLEITAEDDTIVTFGGSAPDAVAAGVDEQRGFQGGSRLPTGRDNVRATYRHGLGTRGNVLPAAVATLVSTAPGLKSVSNPIAGTGGADRESDEQIKSNLPAGMRAFDRAVSLEDHAALARTYSGIDKARAFLERRDPSDPAGLRRLEQPRVRLTVAATDRTPPLQPAFKNALRGFLDARRDPNRPLVISDFTPVTLDVAVTVDPDPDLLPDTVHDAVAAALGAERSADGSYGLFAFERLDFGESLHLSDVYSAVQNVPGVRAALVTRFQHRPRDAAEQAAGIPLIEAHIFIRNTEIVRCDNDPARPERGTLTVTIGEVIHRAG
jgi:uncharacterized phage protein gp47/JayE